MLPKKTFITLEVFLLEEETETEKNRSSVQIECIILTAKEKEKTYFAIFIGEENENPILCVLASLGIMRDQLGATLKPLNTIVCCEVPRDSEALSRDVSLSGSCTSDRSCIYIFFKL